jgi:serine/threonine protein kinase
MTVGEQEFRGTERFRIQRCLGAGGFGVVYQAFDQQRGESVALKALRDGSVEALFRLKREFRALADIAHPNLVRLHELLGEGDQWFFTMELIEGMDFLQFVGGAPFRERADSAERTLPAPSPHSSPVSPPMPSAAARDHLAIGVEGAGDPDSTGPGPQLDTERLRFGLRQAVWGIQALHRAGQLHRDIKPSNVLVARDGRVVLLDFGVVTDLSVAGSKRSISVVGTPAYMSPEQGSARPLSEATDWYSLGVMLFEALTGQWPFTGSFIEMMWDKRHKDAAAPRDLAPGVPSDLDALCVDLLRREPSQRPGGDEILARLGAVQAATYRPSGTAPSAPATAPFVGREEHLRALGRGLEATRAGTAVVVRLHGPSGAGKTAIARRFLQTARRSGAVVLSGRCYERESVPYKALDSLIDALSQFLKKLPVAEAREILPRDVLALARLFPVLRRVEPIAGARRRVLEIPDSQELRRRAFAALRELLARLAEQHDVVLFIDDLQWGDVDSAALLADLLHPPHPPSLLLLACYRASEAAASPFLKRFLSPGGAGCGPDAMDLPVGLLSQSEARDLTLALLGTEASPIGADEIARESGGNPFFLSELVRYAQAGIDPSEAGRVAREAVAAKVTLEEVIRSRIRRLPDSSRRLLEVLAVAGAPLRPALARHAAGLEGDDAPLDFLRVNHLIRTRASGDRDEIEPYHDRIRETVVGQLSPEAIRDHHRLLALALEGSGSADPESLALHFQEAGELDRAAEYAAAAAQRATEALAFDRAARLYRLARELRAGNGAARRTLCVRLGDALVNAGRGAEAAQVYLEAVDGSAAADALELERRAAEQYLSSGHIREGIATLRRVLAKVGLRMAASPRAALVSMIFRRLILRLRGIGFKEHDSTQVPAATLARIDVCWSAAKGLILSDLIRGFDFHARHALLALRAGEPYRVARALTIEAANSGQGGGRTRGRTSQMLEEAMAIAKRIDHPHAIGFALSVAGVTAYLEGRWKDAREFTQRAESVLRERCRGVAWDLDNTHYYALLVLFFLGELKQLGEALPGLLKEAQDRGDLYAVTSMRTRLSYLVRLANDEPARAREELREAIAIWPADVFRLQHWYEMIGQVESLLYAGEGPSAWGVVRERWPLLERSFILRAQSIRIQSLSFRARAAIAADDPEAAALAEKDAGRIERERMPWGNALAKLLRAGVASVREEKTEAIAYLEAAERDLVAADMALHATVARRRRGQLAGGTDGAALVAAANEWMAAQSIRNPERMAAMLAPGKWS